MKKILVYPFDKEFIPVLRYNDLLEGIEINALISPKGWGLSGKSFEFEKKQFIVKTNFEEELQQCDTVWFVDSFNSLYPEELLYEKVNVAIRSDKEIFVIRSNQCEIDNIKNLPNADSIRFMLDEIKGVEISEWADKRKYDIHTPMVGILGMTEESGKFDIQLGIRKFLLEKGYRVSQVGTKLAAALFGIHPFPSFMYDNDYNDRDKIVNFNLFMKKIELVENPDIIILGYPGGTLPVSDEVYNDFGSLSYKLSMALSIDFGIVTSTYGKYNNQYVLNMVQLLDHKYGFPADCFGISERAIDWNDVNPEVDLSYVTVDQKSVESLMEQLDRDDVFYTGNRKGYEEIVSNIEKKLSEYAKVEAI